MNYVDMVAGPLRNGFSGFSRTVSYRLGVSEIPETLFAYVRGLRAEDLFAGAQQQDMVAVIDAAEFCSRFPGRKSPARYDRLQFGATSLRVEEWRGSPSEETPVFFKLLVRGGS